MASWTTILKSQAMWPNTQGYWCQYRYSSLGRAKTNVAISVTARFRRYTFVAVLNYMFPENEYFLEFYLMYSFLIITMQVARLPQRPITKNTE